MPIELYQGEVHLGSVVRSAGGACYAYDPAGRALGTFNDLDAAAAALAARISQPVPAE